MNRFFHNGDGFNNEPDDDSPKSVDFNSHEILSMMELDLAELGLNQQVLQLSIQLASKDWLWRLRRDETKIKRISLMYRKLINILEHKSKKKD